MPAVASPAESGNAARLPLPPPEPGVCRLSVTGSESTDLLTGASHDYPGDGFLTVTTTECGVSLRSDFIVERWQTIDVCNGPDGPTLVGEQIFHSFFGQDDLVIRTCDDSPISDGGVARARHRPPNEPS